MASERPRFWLWAAGALVAGFLLRLAFVMHHPAFAGDALVYGGIARNLLLHGTYGFNDQANGAGSLVILPTLIRVPGYPLFLAACFRLFGIENYTAALYVQLVADLLTCVLVSATTYRLFGRCAGLAVLWAAALCPFTANYVATPITESLVLTTIGLSFYAMLRWQAAGAGYSRWLWLLSAALAASVLLRPEQGLLAASVLPGIFWIERTKMRSGMPAPVAGAGPALAAALCLILALLPWTLRNWHTFHLFQPLAPRSATDPGETSPVGFNRWYRTWGVDFASTDQVYWNVNGARIELAALPDRAFALSCIAPRKVPREALPMYAATAALLDEYNQTTDDTPELDARFAAVAEQRTRAAPLCVAIGLPIARLMNMLLRPRAELLRLPDEWWKPSTPSRDRAFALGYAALGVAYVLLAVAGLIRWLRLCSDQIDTRPILYAMTAAVVLRAALLLTLDNSEPRYTLEFFPIFFVWIGALPALRRIGKSLP
ncbi:MAG: hypothetical protein NVSMB62_06270 [Acidobacteriaceae bacterium]